MDTYFEGILTETESYLDRQCENINFYYEIMQQNLEMEKFINECVVKASGDKRAINEMYVLNEAATIEKIKNFFSRIRDFFVKIFNKLGASLKGVFIEQKKYVDSYKEIILKNKWQCGDVTDIKDRFKGIPRIIDAANNADTAIIGTDNIEKYFKGDAIQGTDNSFINVGTFQNSETIKNAVNSKKETNSNENELKEKAYEEFTNKNTYWGKLKDFQSFKQTDNDGNTNINDTFASWFDGSIKTVTYNSDAIENNFQTIIDVVYAGQSYLDLINKINESVDKKMKEAENIMTNYYNKQKQEIIKALQNQENTSQQKENTETIQQEDMKITGTSSQQPGNNQTNNNSENNPVNKVNNLQPNKMDPKNINNTKYNNTDNKNDIQQKALKLLDDDIANRQTKLNSSINISRVIATKIFDSFSQTNKEFFKIIQAHVQWYLSNPGSEKNRENQAQKNRVLNTNISNINK